MSRIKNLLHVLPALGRRRATFLILAIPLAYSFCQAPSSPEATDEAETRAGQM